MKELKIKDGNPKMNRSENGSNFIGKAVNGWLGKNGIKPILLNLESLGKMGMVKVSMVNCEINV